MHLALQVRSGLQRLPGPVHFLCARAQNSAVTEVDLTDNTDILSHECLQHEYSQSKLHAASPSSACWQQAIAGMVAANAAGQAQHYNSVAESISTMHQLYEWIGAINCGIRGKPASLKAPTLSVMLCT